MIGLVKKDEESNFIVVYSRECVEDSEAVIRVSCKLMPGFTHFRDGDNIEFELWEFAQEDGSFSSYAKPYLTINPHIAKVIGTNEDGEADKTNKMEQTAVEWLYKNLLDNPISNEDVEYNEAVFHNAKEMEKLQLQLTYASRCSFISCEGNDVQENINCNCGKQYYNETFNK